MLLIALAHSLQIPTSPAEDLDGSSLRDSEYALQQITSASLPPTDDAGYQDYDLALHALLSIYHGEDMFQRPEADRRYRRYLRRHARRGLREIHTT